MPVVRLGRLRTSPSGLGWCVERRVVSVAARDSNPGRLPSGRWGVDAAVLTGRWGLLTMPSGVCLHPCARLLAGHPVDPTTVVCGAHTLVWLVRTGHGGVLHSVYLGGSTVRLCCRNPFPSGSPSCGGGCPPWPVASASPGCSLALAGGWLVGWSEGFHPLPPLLCGVFNVRLPLWWAALPSETHCTRVSDSVNPKRGSFPEIVRLAHARGRGTFGGRLRARGTSAFPLSAGRTVCGLVEPLEGDSRRFVGRTAAHVASLLILGTPPTTSGRKLRQHSRAALSAPGRVRRVSACFPSTLHVRRVQPVGVRMALAVPSPWHGFGVVGLNRSASRAPSPCQPSAGAPCLE